MNCIIIYILQYLVDKDNPCCLDYFTDECLKVFESSNSESLQDWIKELAAKINIITTVELELSKQQIICTFDGILYSIVVENNNQGKTVLKNSLKTVNINT